MEEMEAKFPADTAVAVAELVVTLVMEAREEEEVLQGDKQSAVLVLAVAAVAAAVVGVVAREELVAA